MSISIIFNSSALALLSPTILTLDCYLLPLGVVLWLLKLPIWIALDGLLEIRLGFYRLTNLIAGKSRGSFFPFSLCNVWQNVFIVSDFRGMIFWVLNRAVGADDVSIKITHCGVCYADVVWTKNLHNDSKYPVVPGYVASCCIIADLLLNRSSTYCWLLIKCVFLCKAMRLLG